MVIFWREINIIERLTTAPIQNANIIEANPKEAPSIQPIPSISFASPKPIHWPLDTNQRKANGRASTGPATMKERDGSVNKLPNVE